MLELLLDLTRRALEGFVFAAPCVGIWFLGLRFHKKAPPFAHMLAAFGLCLYLSGVLAVTGIGKPFGFFPRISLVPFVDMIKGPVDTTLNVLLFVPLGVLLPMLHPAFRTGGRELRIPAERGKRRRALGRGQRVAVESAVCFAELPHECKIIDAADHGACCQSETSHTEQQRRCIRHGRQGHERQPAEVSDQAHAEQPEAQDHRCHDGAPCGKQAHDNAVEQIEPAQPKTVKNRPAPGFFCAAGANCCARSSGAPSFAAISSSE